MRANAAGFSLRTTGPPNERPRRKSHRRFETADQRSEQTAIQTAIEKSCVITVAIGRATDNRLHASEQIVRGIDDRCTDVTARFDRQSKEEEDSRAAGQPKSLVLIVTVDKNIATIVGRRTATICGRTTSAARRTAEGIGSSASFARDPA